MSNLRCPQCGGSHTDRDSCLGPYNPPRPARAIAGLGIGSACPRPHLPDEPSGAAVEAAARAINLRAVTKWGTLTWEGMTDGQRRRLCEDAEDGIRAAYAAEKRQQEQ